MTNFSLLLLFISSSVCFRSVSVDLPKVNGFAALNTTDSSTVLNWTRVDAVSGYLLSWRHISGLVHLVLIITMPSCNVSSRKEVNSCTV